MSDPKPPAWLKPMNKALMAMQSLGVATGPVRVLTVPGRKSGAPRSTPATPFTLDYGLYVVGGYPRADWVLNARAAGTGTVTRGRKSERVTFVSSRRSRHARCCVRSPTKCRGA